MASRQFRLVFFTLIALAAIAGGVFVVTREQGTILSPGPLSVFHAELDNEPGCYECHTEAADFRGLSDEQCLACHQTLEERITAKRGYHAKVTDSCDACHSEHHGLTGEDGGPMRTVRWPPAEAALEPTTLGSIAEEDQKRQAFPHELSGFELRDAHAELGCTQCHSINLILDSAVVDFIRKPEAEEGSRRSEDYLESYLGLQTVCGDCHHDPHVPSMGAACDDCHTEEAWTPSTNFVHEPPNTRYPLEGKHADVDCNDCHIKQPTIKTSPPPPGLPTFEHVVSTKQPPVFRGVGFGRSPARAIKDGEQLPECENCHGNVHRQASEAFWECKSCHDESGWKPWKESGFDHDRDTSFKLLDGHRGVACDECHGKKEGSEGPLALPAREGCTDCHDDVHEGAFDREMALARGKSCEVCHDLKDWKKPTYATSDHPKKVPLIETHASIRCEDCHGQTSKASCQLLAGGKPECVSGPPFARLPEPGGRVGPLEQECASCHRDIHEGRLTAPQLRGADCTDCHGFEAWAGAEFNEAQHASLGFPINGAHKKIFDECVGCHGGSRTRDGGLRQVTVPNADQDCNACHEEDDVHKGQLGTNCGACHSEDTWKTTEFTIAQHQETDFPLNGAHMAVPCEVCHEPDPRTQVQKWKFDDTTCEGCHRTPHGRQFRQQTCDDCHTESAWAPSTYDISRHNKTRFKLEGPHDTGCKKCHQPDPGGKVDRYLGTTRACAGCHVDVHMGQFTGRHRDCTACHVEASWRPSFFDHDKARYKLDGAHRGVACDRCHQTTERTLPTGDAHQVAHYYPIPGRKCDDCHQNPHQVGEGE